MQAPKYTYNKKKTYITLNTLEQLAIHYVTDKKWLYNLLDNAAGNNRGLSNIKFGKLFHQDV